ncbi:hypothetical protein TYRP_000704 [Tyrophagus putrescentiae]|nr:hypothetical protein TYRP_000704 [Tyrophagus putrescentiae]
MNKKSLMKHSQEAANTFQSGVVGNDGDHVEEGEPNEHSVGVLKEGLDDGRAFAAIHVRLLVH